MKHLKYIMFSMVTIFLLVTGCQEDDVEFGEIVAPSNIQIEVDIVGANADNPNGDGSGVVHFTATADNAISYQYTYNGATSSAPNGMQTYNFATLGLNTYTITVVAFGTGGASSSQTIDVEVLSLYEPPADLITMLTNDSSRTWRIKSEGSSHFGLGPVGGIFNEFYGASPDEKAGVGMYDDRYIFNVDGTFTHITNNTNDDGGNDPSGTVFGREVLINELNGPGEGVQNGADIENYPYSDYQEQWFITAPGGVETINLTGVGFLGYYIGGDHTYKIEMRSANEMSVRSTDGNSEFDWGFVLTSEEGATNDFNTIYNDLTWQDEFDVDGAPSASNWTYDIGTGDNGWGNQEAQYYTDDADNIIIEDGYLKITAKAESFGGSEYTSSRIKSQNLFDFTYGRVEFRAKLPEGGGTWPALWMLGSNFTEVGWPNCGEIDVLEHVGNNQNQIHGTLHFPGNSGGNAIGGQVINPTASSDFHLYSVEWRPDEIIFLLDDEPYFSFDNNESLPFNDDFFLIINFAMGGNFGGDIDPGFVESTLEVDYVRVYQ